jgi:hypothetical protein
MKWFYQSVSDIHGLHSDPRFIELLRKIGVEPE